MEIKILRRVLAANEAVAKSNRELFSQHGVLVINLMSSPGSGKTCVIEKSVKALKDNVRIAVIIGDITSTIDAQRLSGLGIPIVQINTEPFGGECHLEASWVREAALSLELQDLDLIFIENVGNLVCPAEFDTGADKNVVIVSLPEGEDKPLKYPLMFRISNVMLVNKIDLANVLDVDKNTLHRNALQVNPNLQIFDISAKTGEGFGEWLKWIEGELRKKRSPKSS